MDWSPPGSSVHGIFQARILECVAISSSRGSSQSRDQTQVSCIAGRCFTVWATRKDYVYYIIIVLVKTLQKKQNQLHVNIKRNKEIYNEVFFTCPWKLRSLEIYGISQQGADLIERRILAFQSSSSAEGLRPRKNWADISACLKAGSPCPTLKNTRVEKFPHVQKKVSPFILFRTEADWTSPAQSMEDNFPYCIHFWGVERSCALPSLLHGLFSSGSECGLLCNSSAQASYCSSFSCCGAQTLGYWDYSSCGTWAQ